MSSFRQRLLTITVGVPSIFILCFGITGFHHLAFMLLALVATYFSAREIKKMGKIKGIEPKLSALLPPLLILASWAETFYPGKPLNDLALSVILLTGLALEIKNGEKESFSRSFERMGITALMIFYPGYFFTFLVRLTVMEQNSLLLLLFFVLVFSNDIFAYVAGMLFGKRRNIVKVSPNKSLAGFIGGHVMSVAAALIFCAIFPDFYLSPVQCTITALVISFCANLGDLIESTIKRSAGVKDSGSIFPGRGGMLDSTDSLLAAAPFFWLLVNLL